MTSPLDAEDMEALNRSIASLRSLGGEEIDLVLAEYDRMRGKLEEITDGKTTLFLSEEDRALHVQDLDDVSLAAWARWVFLNMERVRERMRDQGDLKEGDADTITVGAMQGVIGLALLTFGAGNSLAFAQGFFLFRQLHVFRLKDLGIDQKALFAGRDIKLPEIIT